MACGIVVRACGGDQGALWRYAGYVAIYVWLPGVLVLGAFSGRRVSWVDALAVGLPVGFAIEIFTYVLLSVLGLRVLFAWSPVVWVVGLLLPAGRRARWRDASPTVAGWRPWLICALAGVGLVMVVTTAAHYYVAAPLSPQGGLLAATHQDWIYLISRAAELKLRWPWSDPSLAGTPLSYHYFLMVHLAAASTVTRIALSELLLRLCVLPLTVALIMQGFVLGRALTHRAAGGVLAVVLFLVADQVSFAGAVEANPFSDLFVHWLYISPTFFFGMVFLGAVLIWAHRVVVGAAVRLMDLLILAVLAAAATGAKGSVMPPLLLALGAWMVVEIVVRRRFPWRMLAAIGAMTVGFGVVYFPVLRGWGTGAARFVPLVSLQVADFWTAHLLTWQRALTAAGLSESLSRWLAQAACAGVILAGSHGVRLLAWPYLWGFRRRAEPGLTVWLGSVYLASLLFGWFIYLDSQAQLYVYYQMRLPAAVLAAGAVISLYSAGQRRWNEGGQAAWSYPGMLALGLAGGTLIILVVSDGLSPWLAMVALGLAALAMPRRWLRADQPTAPAAEVGGGWRMVGGLAPVLLVGAILLVQINNWRLRDQSGLRLWLEGNPAVEDRSLALLQDGLAWIRTHTPVDAVIVANAFTPRNCGPDHLAVLDHTTVDKYFYYSAFGERRLWVEGPAYLLDQTEADKRMRLAERIFFGHGGPEVLPAAGGPCYLLVDRALRDGAAVQLPRALCLYENERISVYRLPAGGR